MPPYAQWKIYNYNNGKLEGKRKVERNFTTVINFTKALF